MKPSDTFADPKLWQGAGPLFFSDGWTGTGEVLAVHKLSRLFARAGVELSVKRSRYITYDDLRSHNVIIIGSPWGNPILDSLRLHEAPFTCCGPAGAFPSAIINHFPRLGEPEMYRNITNPHSKGIVTTHGLFSVLKGVQKGSKIIVSAGITTHSSWAALDYFTSAAGIDDLTRALGTEDRLPPYFQAVIRTDILNGEASNVALVAACVIDAERLP